MKNVHQWLAEYKESHQNNINKAIHFICVPSIFFAITGLLYSVKIPGIMVVGLELNAAMIAMTLIVIYYFSLSPGIALGMLLMVTVYLEISKQIEDHIEFPLWAISLTIFIIGWIGQFLGHQIEGKKPSFFKDVQFLLIGPAWIMSYIYKLIGIRF